MFRRLSAFVVVGLVAGQTGCLSRCDSRPGWFTSHARTGAPCQTVGRNTGCFDAATGHPVPCPPEGAGVVVPGGAIPGGALPGPAPGFPNVGPTPNELHMPSPADMIRPPAVPVPAPGDATLPFPAGAGVPVKNK